jgi:hypothetical protein
MHRTFSRLKYAFLGLFLLGSAGSAYYQIWVVKPRQDCERKGGWWDRFEGVCATPIDISQFTGRPRVPPTSTPSSASTPPPAAPSGSAPQARAQPQP